MNIETKYKDEKLVFTLSGELDHHAAKSAVNEILSKIEGYVPRDCILDMQGLTFMDSSGIAVVLKTYKCMNELGGRLYVENVSPQPLKVLDASGIDRMVKITALIKE